MSSPIYLKFYFIRFLRFCYEIKLYGKYLIQFYFLVFIFWRIFIYETCYEIFISLFEIESRWKKKSPVKNFFQTKDAGKKNDKYKTETIKK